MCGSWTSPANAQRATASLQFPSCPPSALISRLSGDRVEHGRTEFPPRILELHTHRQRMGEPDVYRTPTEEITSSRGLHGHAGVYRALGPPFLDSHSNSRPGSLTVLRRRKQKFRDVPSTTPGLSAQAHPGRPHSLEFLVRGR